MKIIVILHLEKQVYEYCVRGALTWKFFPYLGKFIYLESLTTFFPIMFS